MKFPDELHFVAPSATCNAWLKRRTGYCDLPAGKGTDHPGEGRCRLHGGLGPEADGADGPRDHFMSIGLGPILQLAEVMTRDDTEYLMHVGNTALVVSRASLLARLQNPDVSPKEAADITMAVSRIDTLLSKYPDDEDPDAAPNTATVLDEELARLAELEASLGAEEGGE